MPTFRRLPLLLLLLPLASAEERPSGTREKIRELVDAVRGEGDLDRIRAAAGNLLETASPSGGLASTLRDPAISASVGVSGAAKISPYLSAGAGVEPGKGKLILKTPVAGVEVGADPESRTVSVTFSVGASSRWAGGQKVFSLELAYPDNRTYYNALGADGRSIPGTATVLDTVDRLLGRAAPDVQAETPDGAAEAALSQLTGQLVPEMFRSGTEFTSVTVGVGEKISIAAEGGSIAVSEMRKTRMRAGSEERVEFVEQGAETSLSVDAEAVEAEATLALSVSSDPEAQRSPAQLELARRLEAAEGDPSKALRSYARERLLPVVERVPIARAIELFDQCVHEAIDEVDRLFVMDDPVVGGVKLHINPMLLQASHPPDRVANLLESLGRHAGDGNLIVRYSPESFTVRCVSLRDAVARGALGLSRVRGFVERGGEFLLLGDAAEPGLPVEWLSALLRTIWREGRFPAVSLDPDPADPAGPQALRVYGLPEDLLSCDAVRLMVEADYAMKRIDLEEDDPGVRGLSTTLGLYRASPPGLPLMSRMWLTPSDPWTGDIVESAREGATCVWFRSGVRARSERLALVSGELRGTGEVDPIEDAAAESFTAHYEEIAAARPVFAELAGLFDLAKLCAILRVRGVRHPSLDAAAGRAVPKVELQRNWPGIGPKPIEGSAFALSGGATTRSRTIDRRPFEDSRIEGLEAAAAGATYEVPGAPCVSAAGPVGQSVAADLLANRALLAFSEMRAAEAYEFAEKAVAADAEHPAALGARALAAAATGRTEVALADARSLFAEDPRYRALAAMLLAVEGRRAEALEQCDLAAAELADDRAGLLWTGRARLYALDFAGADAVVDRLASTAGDDPEVLDFRTELDISWALGPARARARIDEIRRVPLDLAEAYQAALGRMKRFDAGGAAEGFANVLDEAEKRGISANHLPDRCRLGIAVSRRIERQLFGRVDALRAQMALDSGSAAARQLTEAHPDWPSAWMAAAWFDESPELLDRFEAAAANEASDPLLPELRATLGADRFVPFALFTFWHHLPDKSDPAALKILDRLLAHLGDAPEGRLLRVYRAFVHLPAAAALRPLRKAFLDWPEDAPRDPVAILSYAFVGQTILAASSRGPDPAPLFEDACLVFRRTGGDASSWEILTALAAVRMQAVEAMAEADKRRQAANPRLRLLRRDAANGKYDAAAADRVLAEVAAARREETEAAAGPFAAAILEALRPLRLEKRFLLALALDASEDLPEGDGREARQQALLGELQALGPEAGGMDAAALVRAAEAARSPVDARGIGIVGDALEANQAYLPPDMVEELRRCLARARQRARPSAAPAREPRDWKSWEAR